MKGIEIWLADLDTLFRDLESGGAPARGLRPSARFHAPRVLLGIALSATGEHSASEWKFDVNKPGQLTLEDGETVTRVDFDMSQSGQLVAVALSSSGPVGLSLETLEILDTDSKDAELDPVGCAIRESVFTERELDQLDAMGEPGSKLRWAAAQRMWAAKDARAKRAAVLSDPNGADAVSAGSEDSSEDIGTGEIRSGRWSRLEGRDLVFDQGRYYLALSAEAGAASEIRMVEFVSRADGDTASESAAARTALAESPLDTARPAYLKLAKAPTSA